MSELPIHGSGPVRPGGDGAPDARGPERAGDTASFRALLERLGQRASELRESAPEVRDAHALSGAVEGARESLDEALALGDRLLEAYRQRLQQGGAEDGVEGDVEGDAA